jgi:hypothetical protein
MKVTEIDFELDWDAANNVPLVPQGPRTPGLHASDIYGGLASKLEPERYPAGSKPHKVITCIGLAWEQWFERTLIGMGYACVRPPEQVALMGKTKVYYSPDLVIVNGVVRLGEIKTTSMTSKDGIEGPKFAKYHAQTQLYCHWEETPYARIFALFLRGDYKFMKKGAARDDDGFPELHVYDIEYSARELQDNYETHYQFAKTAGMIQV